MNYWHGLGLLALCLGLGLGSGFMERFKAQAEAEYTASITAYARPEAPARPEPRRASPQPVWRDAVGAAGFAPPPGGMPAAPQKAKPASSSAMIPKDAPRIKAGDIKELMAGPENFIVSRTWLGKPAGFARFMSDPARAKGYVSNPFVRAVLDQPKVVKALMGNARLRSAFLNSPAMNDPKVLDALSSSFLMKELAGTKGVAAVISDPAEVRKLFTAPDMASWLMRNPNGAAVLAGLTGA